MNGVRPEFRSVHRHDPDGVEVNQGGEDRVHLLEDPEQVQSRVGRLRHLEQEPVPLLG